MQGRVCVCVYVFNMALNIHPTDFILTQGRYIQNKKLKEESMQ